MTMAEALNLMQSLIPNPDVYQPRPLQYHDRTLQVLPEGEFKLQDQLNMLMDYCMTNDMLIKYAQIENQPGILLGSGRTIQIVVSCTEK